MRQLTVSPVEHARHWPHPTFPDTDLLHARYVDYAFGRHRHAQYTFGVVTEGLEDFHYRGELHHAGTGTVSLVDADTVHTGQAGSSEGWRYQVLYADAELMRSVMNELGRPGLPSFPDPVVYDAQAVSVMLRAHGAAARGDRLAASEHTLRALRLLVRRYARLTRARPAEGDAGSRLVADSAAVLRARLVGPPSIDELAELAGCSPFALIRAFRRHVGLPPHAYLTQCRIDRARDLLVGGADVASTAVEVGFADQAHLTRHFRRHVGVPPARFARERKNVQESPSLRA